MSTSLGLRCVVKDVVFLFSLPAPAAVPFSVTTRSTCRCLRNHRVEHKLQRALALYLRSPVSRCVVPGSPRSLMGTFGISARQFTQKAFKNLPPQMQAAMKKKQKTTLNYMLALTAVVLGFSYAAVPMYRIFCQVTGIGGASNLAQHGGDKVESLKKLENHRLKIYFNADTSSRLHWHFKPLQREVTVFPGETALAFYTARNPTDKPIVGISTYTVLPYEAAKYLNKIQCFCFEEQRLNPHEQGQEKNLSDAEAGALEAIATLAYEKVAPTHAAHFSYEVSFNFRSGGDKKLLICEEVDMPVFFYIDPEFVNDPWLQNIDSITLSYTFFEAKDASKWMSFGQPTNAPVPHIAPA